MTDPKFVAFSTQKGGAGKTTLTVLAASYLYYVKGLKVLVVDCDYPQFSIEEMRQRDKDLIECSPQFKKLFSDNLRQTKLAPYPLLTAKPEEAMQKVRDIIEAGNEIDIVFFDLPGTVNNRGVVNILNCMDTVIVPVAADKVILESSLAFALKIQEWLTTGRTQVKQMYMLWNLVDAREKTDLYDQYEAVFEEYGLMTLKTKIPDTKKYRREGSKTLNRAVFRSTVMPPDKTLLKGTRLPELTDEVLGLTQTLTDMAKKYESEIDPDEFIRSFREESSSLSTLKRKPKESPAPDTSDSTEDRAASTKSNHAPPEQSSTDTKREALFRERFITRTTYLRPQVKFLMVEIDPVLIGKIKRLIAFENGSCSLKSYINNVLASHFEEYADVINPKL